MKKLALLALLALGSCTFPTAMSASTETIGLDIAAERFVLKDAIEERKVVPVQGTSFHVVLRNVKTHTSIAWKHVYPNERTCEAAIKGIQEVFDAVADPDPEHTAKEPEDADPELVASIGRLLASMIQNTGTAPHLEISCQSDGI